MRERSTEMAHVLRPSTLMRTRESPTAAPPQIITLRLGSVRPLTRLMDTIDATTHSMSTVYIPRPSFKSISPYLLRSGNTRPSPLAGAIPSPSLYHHCREWQPAVKAAIRKGPRAAWRQRPSDEECGRCDRPGIRRIRRRVDPPALPCCDGPRTAARCGRPRARSGSRPA